MKSLAFAGLAVLMAVGCQSETTTNSIVDSLETVETTPVAFNVEGAPTVEFEVPDMMCEFGCAAKVKDLLAAQQGVKDVKVEFEDKKAVVAVNKEEFDSEAAVATLIDYQFPNTKLISNN